VKFTLASGGLSLCERVAELVWRAYPLDSIPVITAAQAGQDHHAPLVPKGRLLPFVLVTALFFLWGIPNNLNDILIRQFMKSFEMTRLQAGLVGYSSYQTTDKTGPTIAPEQQKAHYRVSSLGFTTNFTLPAQKLSLGFKYFSELSGRSTFQGYSAQISGSIRF